MSKPIAPLRQVTGWNMIARYKADLDLECGHRVRYVGDKAPMRVRCEHCLAVADGLVTP